MPIIESLLLWLRLGNICARHRRSSLTGGEEGARRETSSLENASMHCRGRRRAARGALEAGIGRVRSLSFMSDESLWQRRDGVRDDEAANPMARQDPQGFELTICVLK